MLQSEHHPEAELIQLHFDPSTRHLQSANRVGILMSRDIAVFREDRQEHHPGTGARGDDDFPTAYRSRHPACSHLDTAFLPLLGDADYP